MLIDIDSVLVDKLTELYLAPFVTLVKVTGRNRFVVEYKSPRDRLKERDFSKILAYQHHYIYKTFEDEKSRNTDVLIIISQHESFLDKYPRVELSPGLFQYEYLNVKINVLEIDSLEIIPANYSLLLFAPRIKLIEFLKSMLVDKTFHKKEEFINHASLYNLEELYMAAESLGVELDPQLRKNRKKLLQILGEEEVIHELDEERMINVIGEEKVIDIIGKRLSPEKRKQLKELFKDK